MGRWLARLQSEEKISETLKAETDKTDKTPADDVLSVLSVRHGSECEKQHVDADDVEDARIAFEERAAILEYHDGLTRDEAERLAARVGVAEVHVSVEPDVEAVGSSANPTEQVAVEPVCRVPRQTSAAGGRPPQLGPGITILRPAVEVPAAEYDSYMDAMIAALPPGSAEAKRLAFAKRKGWCVDRGSERIFARGRA